MSIDFSSVKEWTIPEGKVASVSVNGVQIWTADTGPDYLCFTALEDNSTVSIVDVGAPGTVRLKYSFDKKNWSTFTTNSTVVTLAESGNKVYFMGNNTHMSYSTTNYRYFSMTGKLDVSGNIMSLFDETLEQDYFSKNYACAYLFKESQSLISASKLKLPATTLTQDCYYEMFYRSTSIIYAPTDLPATSAQYSCYSSMFEGCTALKTTPKISALTFSGREACARMFYGCTALESANAIKTEHPLTLRCFDSMFYGCTSLKSVTVHFKDFGNNNSETANWMHNVSNAGTFYCPSELVVSTRGSSTVPDGWTIVRI